MSQKEILCVAKKCFISFSSWVITAGFLRFSSTLLSYFWGRACEFSNVQSKTVPRKALRAADLSCSPFTHPLYSLSS